MSTKAYNDKRKKIKARRVQHLHRLKVKLGCQLCGYNEHGAALVFDHIDPSTKSHYCVGQGKGGSGMNGLTKRICLPGSRPDSSKKNRQNIKLQLTSGELKKHTRSHSEEKLFKCRFGRKRIFSGWEFEDT